jgi:hypothetical protein
VRAEQAGLDGFEQVLDSEQGVDFGVVEPQARQRIGGGLRVG